MLSLEGIVFFPIRTDQGRQITHISDLKNTITIRGNSCLRIFLYFIAWVASLASSTMYLFAAVATSLAERYGSRIVVIIGSFVSASGLLASSFVTTLQPLYATYGVVWGLGTSLGLFPSIVILTKYFRRRLALASGLALAGAACGTLVIGPVIQFLASKYGIAVTLRILACAQSVMFLCGLTFRPVKSEGGKGHPKKQRKLRSCLFKNRAYTIWVAALCVFMLVFLIPFVHLVSSHSSNYTFIFLYRDFL